MNIEATNLSRTTRDSFRLDARGVDADGVYQSGLRYGLSVCNTGFGTGKVYRLAYFDDKAEAIAEAKREARQRAGEENAAVYVSDSALAGAPQYIAYPGLGEEYVAGRWIAIE